MLSTNTQGLSSERLEKALNVDLNDIQCSAICGEILWKPVSCQNCETHFCLRCIQQWHERHPGNCPLRCTTYAERPCSKFILRQLARIQVKCIYESNGCTEVEVLFMMKYYIICVLGHFLWCIRKTWNELWLSIRKVYEMLWERIKNISEYAHDSMFKQSVRLHIVSCVCVCAERNSRFKWTSWQSLP